MRTALCEWHPVYVQYMYKSHTADMKLARISCYRDPIPVVLWSRNIDALIFPLNPLSIAPINELWQQGRNGISRVEVTSDN